MIWLIALAGIAAGYALGRYRPLHRASDWANWQKYDRHMRRHSTRWWKVVIILSAENIAWMAAHPVQGWHAWQHRNDPPPPRSPAPKIDPDWAAKRRAAAEREEQDR